ncbi:hypothetical protein [Nonomuraea longicatena]|uniref:Uncharacterized protein n=1 Tax=Nonomuraea longicatena TaxID=83682 RepID=A0ABN1QWV3_9ACTN
MYLHEMSTVRASAAIYRPRAAEMTLRDSTDPDSDAMFLTLAQDHVWITLNGSSADPAAEAEAMERLADLATEAAARLRALPQAPAEAMEAA